jgi:hypothetical protein
MPKRSRGSFPLKIIENSPLVLCFLLRDGFILEPCGGVAEEHPGPPDVQVGYSPLGPHQGFPQGRRFSTSAEQLSDQLLVQSRLMRQKLKFS